MLTQRQVERHVRGRGWSLWITLLVCWALWNGYAAWQLNERASDLVARNASVAARAGVAIGYNVALNRILLEWAVGTGVLAVLLFVSRGRTRVETLWFDEQGNEVRGPE